MKKFNLILAFMLVSLAMNATTYKGEIYKDSTIKACLSTLPYDETTGAYDVKIRVSDDKQTITILDWTGAQGDDIDLTFDETGFVYAVNGVNLPDADGYYSTWVNTGGLYETGYYGIYVYGGGYFKSSEIPYSKVTMNDDGSGEGYFEVYSYDDNGYRHVYFRWGTEEAEDISEAEYPLLVSKSESSFTALPYNENGEYLTTVKVASDLSYIKIMNWTGEADGSGESIKIYPSAEDGSVQNVNGSTEGCYLGLGSQMDGDVNYTYAYAGGYGTVEFYTEDGSEGGGYIYLYQYSAESSATYEFSWPGELQPTQGIKNVDAEAADADVTYNIAGQRVNADAKGLVIRGGKTYLNK